MPDTSQMTLDFTKQKNNEDKILEYLLRGNSLTVGECRYRFATTELRTYIARIRKRGYNVVDKWIVTDNGERIKLYWIE